MTGTVLGIARREIKRGPMQPLERAGNTYALAGFLSYPEFDPSPFPSLVRLLEREKVQRPAALALPFACPPAGQGAG
jgi:hypothetical protein